MYFTRAALLIAIPAAIAAQQPERVTLDGNEIAIYNLVGTLRVEGGTGDRVIVEVTRKGRDAGRLKLETGSVRGRSSLRVVYPEDRIYYSGVRWNGRTTFSIDADGTFGDSNGRRNDRDRRRIEVSSRNTGLDAHADLHVIVPRGKKLFLRQGVGETTVDNIEGTVDVGVSASGVRVSHIKGSLRVETGSGEADILDVTGDVTVECGSGGATLDGLRGGRLQLDIGSGSLRGRALEFADIRAEVGSGGVRLSGVKAPRFWLESGSGSSDVELLTLPEDVDIEAGSGGITLRLPAATSASVDIETGSGGITSDFDVKVARIERRAMRGTIGDGKGRIRIESGSGSVRLLRV